MPVGTTPAGRLSQLTQRLYIPEFKNLRNSSIFFVSLSHGPTGLVNDLPAGVQIIGRRFREDLILNAMQVIEDQTGVLTKELWAREDFVQN